MLGNHFIKVEKDERAQRHLENHKKGGDGRIQGLRAIGVERVAFPKRGKKGNQRNARENHENRCLEKAEENRKNFLRPLERALLLRVAHVYVEYFCASE